jgi:GH15 family glucan-1,4-alpha-glucosidase
MFCLPFPLLSIFSYGSSLSASWIRDSSFTLYALIRLGFTEEANGEFNLS